LVIFSNIVRLAGIPLPVVIVWVVVKANWFTYASTEGQHVSPSPLFTFTSLAFLISFAHPLAAKFMIDSI
jgi:hypothetical protein